MKEMTVRDFFDAKKKDLALSLVTEPETLDNLERPQPAG